MSAYVLAWGYSLFQKFYSFLLFFEPFFHVSLAPAIAIGCAWPPLSIQPLDIWGLPLTNTILLLTSGVALTLAHYDIMNINETPRNIAMSNFLVTLFLGITFLYCQFIEYRYGITFFLKRKYIWIYFFCNNRLSWISCHCRNNFLTRLFHPIGINK